MEIQLLRPVNCIITAIAVLIGAFVSESNLLSTSVWLAIVAAALITGAGNAYNDLCDLEIDKINRPQRPLPSGRVTQIQAFWIAGSSAIIGLIMAALASPTHGLAAAITILCLWLYSRYLKRILLLGNLMVAALAAICFPFGALSAGSVGRAWIPAGFAFLFHFGREIVKDIEDMVGDRSVGARTIALTFGSQLAAGFVAVVYAFLVFSTYVPYHVGIYGWEYLLIVGLVDLLVLGVIVHLIAFPLRRPLTTSTMLTVLMPLGQLSIVAGEFFR